MSTQHTGEPTAIGGGDRPLETGDVVGEYVIQDLLGKGGFGTVYRAAHPVIGKQVAIKVLARRYSSDEAMVSRFVAEARAVNQIRHRNIIDIFSFGQLPDGRHYYVMEYLDGAPLDRHLADHGALPVEQAMPILRAIARALDAAHAKGIAHRDLKPENILVSFDEEGNTFPKLLDFGIAKLMTPDEEGELKHRTATGAPIGTPQYMSPEQCRGRDVDHRTDIYSFGIVAYRVLTGAYPFEADGYLELMMLQINQEAAPPSSRNPALSPAIDAAIAAMMKKDPNERPASLSAAVAAMDDGRASGPALTPSLLPARPSQRRSSPAVEANAPTQLSAPSIAPAPRRSRAPLWIALVGVLGAAGALAAWAATRGGGEPPAPAPAPIAPAVAASPSPPPIASPAPDAGQPQQAIITFEGAPEGTHVLVGGKEIGVAPTVILDRSTSPTVLTLTADGYLSVPVKLTADKDQSVTVTMKKKPRTGTARPRPGPGKDDIYHHIPGLEE